MFNIANLFTAANMISGILAILLAFMGRIDLAPIAIFAGALFDFFDGFIARKMGFDGEMGKQLDSLADMVTFGLAPGIIMMVLMTMDVREFIRLHQYELIHYDFFNYLWSLFEGEINFALPFFALVIPFFSMFRLAKFNIDKRQTSSFIGLNTPANTLFLMTFPLVLSYSDIEYNTTTQMLFDPVYLSVIIIVMSVLMVVPLPMFSLKFKTYGWKTNEFRYVFLLISTAFILIFKTWAIALIVILYLILSLVENVVLKKKKMKFKAEIDVMPLDALLDPQGKAVTSSMKNIGLNTIEGVRIGRHVRLFVDANSQEEAGKMVEDACKKLLANQIMESYSYSLQEA